MKIWEYRIKIHTRDYTRRVSVHGDDSRRFIEKLKNNIKGKIKIDPLKISRCIDLHIDQVTGDKKRTVGRFSAFVQCSPKEFTEMMFYGEVDGD